MGLSEREETYWPYKAVLISQSAVLRLLVAIAYCLFPFFMTPFTTGRLLQGSQADDVIRMAPVCLFGAERKFHFHFHMLIGSRFAFRNQR